MSSEQAEIRQKKSRMPQCAALLEPLVFNLKIHSVLGLWIEAPLSRVGVVGSTSLEAEWEQRLSGHGQSVDGFGQYHWMIWMSTQLWWARTVNKGALLSWRRLKAFASSQGRNGPGRAELLQGAL